MIQIKTIHKKRNLINGNLAIALSVLLVASTCLVVYTYLTKRGPFSQKQAGQASHYNYSPPTPEEKSNGDAIKEQSAAASDPTPDPIKPTDSTETHHAVVMDITALEQSSGTLYVRTLIQVITSSGTCSLSMKGPSSKTYAAISSVQAGPSSSVCQGFNIPVSSLSHGSWTVFVSFQNDTLRGSASKEISIQ